MSASEPEALQQPQCKCIETETASRKRILLVFDFDHTLVNENTDKYIVNLAPDKELPEEFNKLYKGNNWIQYMDEIFRYLHTLGKTKEDILQCMAEIPFTDGMTELLHYRKEDLDVDCIIISDSNSVFINHILHVANLSHSILKIFTNPAKFDSAGRLTLEGYHHQDSCSLSSENLCKGVILKQFLQERLESSINYNCVYYVGDGFNDLCPGLVLHENDFLMPRVGFKLQSTIEKMEEKNEPVSRSDLKANVVLWETGFDIIQHIENWTQS